MMTTPQYSSAASVPSFAAYFARLFEYDRWANRRVLEAMESLDDRLPTKPVDRLSHLLICQKMWNQRFVGVEVTIKNFFPSWTLAQVQENEREISALMERFIADLPAERWFTPFAYTDSEGGRFTNQPIEILTQLSQHGCYHRGQIACELNPLLPQLLTTDYIFYCRLTQDDGVQLA